MDTSSSTSPPPSPPPPSSISVGRVIAPTKTTAANSPSNISYSPGASCLSTRNTSPDHATAVISISPINNETATSRGHSKSSSSSSCSHIAASSSASSSPSPLAELRLKTDIKYTPNTLLDTGDNNYSPTSAPQTQTAPADAKMDRNPFQTVNDGRSKMVTDRCLYQHPTGSPAPNPAIVQFQFHQTQNSSLGPSGGSGSGDGGSGGGNVQALGSPIQTVGGGLLSPAAPRGLASSNWRGGNSILDDVPSSSSRANSSAAAAAASVYSPFDPTAGGSSRNHPNSSFYGSSFSSQLSSTGGTAEVAGVGSGSVFSDAQLDASYAYCFDRGNGQFTRLVPADALPPLRDVPAIQHGCAGMLVLPLPRAAPPGGRSGNANVSTEPSRIDNIVASTPSTPTHHQVPTSSSTAAGQHSHADSHSHPHHHSLATPSTNPIINTASTNKNPPPHPGSHHHNHHSHHHQPHHQHHQQQQRRPKIYCDKWVHEGVCAFTQQGCKYKHEMPFDKVTQHQLGLFHGFPAWWKKHQAELARQRDPVPPPSPLDSAGGAGGRDSRGGGGREDDEGRLAMDVGERFLTGRSGGAAAAGGGAGAGVGRRDDRGESVVGCHGVDAGGSGMMLGGSGRLSAAGAPAAGFAWRRGPIVPSNAGLGIGVGLGVGEHSGDTQVGNMATSMAAPSGRSGTLGSSALQRGGRNPLVSYGSPFGPIAPPARAASATAALAAAAKTAGPGSGPKPTGSGVPTAAGANPSRSTGGASSIPTANPYASLEALEDEDRIGKGVLSSAAVIENGRENEGESGSISAKKANTDAPRFA
ncbi:hypothetical protein DL764_008280 [Monosporascus ibericus]|uniref:C3H1-type domain-containing protein n=1 Tax=Monosporascus ibericus TaxID=155417 RepID=A0A4Q4T0W6_9PEZI|nr:hypothetical protein DL764_008280 [Monosporascus ibericus]